MKKIIKREPGFLELAEQDFLKWQLESNYSEKELCHFHQVKRLLDVYDKNDKREKQKKTLENMTIFISVSLFSLLALASVKGIISEYKMKIGSFSLLATILACNLIGSHYLEKKQKLERDYYISKLKDISPNFPEIECKYQKILQKRGINR